MRPRRVVVAMVFAIGLLAGRLPAQEAPPVADSSFRAFLAVFDSGLVAFLNGDPARWLANSSHADAVTLMTPFGANVRGWAAVENQYALAARRFAPGSTVGLEYVATGGQGDLAYTVVMQRGVTRSVGSDTSRRSFTRATNIFSRENGQWKLVHRHMDHLLPGGVVGPPPAPPLPAAAPGSVGVPPVPDPGFRAFLASFEAGQVQLLNGDARLWLANASHADDVTLLNPFGVVARGWIEVSTLYKAVAARLAPSGATVRLEYMAIEVHGDFAYEVVKEYATSRPVNASASVEGQTRATHVFRREAGEWKLVHRHMDQLEPRQ